ncbi:cation:proton antiporter [Granulicella sp. dw_53]|uniref:cation:proton antiporter n=1 Tax=Granulicella sp. dw_53 TaxID=2719792 RepID=UPI001BD67CEA|nr:cation:proton antiporter [Granulicella sp. dw_53]
MTFFESLLVLLLVAIALLQVARRLSLPYPAMLAGAGALVALIPGAPAISIEPSTYLALFIVPALVDAAYDFPPGATRRFLAPLVTYAVFAVVLTTGVVAWIAWALLGLPLAAGIALGAIVAPPDAAAASAVLRKFRLPRRTDAVLKGESLFNDATALLLFSGALTVLGDGGLSLPVGLRIVLAAPGGLLLGILWAYVVRYVNRLVKDTLGGNVLQFVLAYLIWIAAVHLRLSAVLCVIGFAMTLARKTDPADFDARMRVQSYAVWSSVVFTLNVFAFLLMGMQARSIVMRMQGTHLREALGFAGLVILAVVCTRLIVVLGFTYLESRWESANGGNITATVDQAFFVGWCGMRGFVTMTTAFALPVSFPHRDTVVLTAFSVVLATLVFQGLTLAPLVRLLKLDRSIEETRELASARVVMANVGLASIADQHGPEAENLRYRLSVKLQRCVEKTNVVPLDRLREFGLTAIKAERTALEDLRGEDKIGPANYLGLQEQLDWNELTLLRDADRQIEEI